MRARNSIQITFHKLQFQVIEVSSLLITCNLSNSCCPHSIAHIINSHVRKMVIIYRVHPTPTFRVNFHRAKKSFCSRGSKDMLING
jgi:hypothetical protein